MACKEQDYRAMGEPDDRFKAGLETLGKSRVYFGHQSVGKNIMAGLDDLLKATGGTLNVVELKDGQADFPESYFMHSRIGKNEFPETKCDAFGAALRQVSGDSSRPTPLDAALLKFCYVDITEKTDVKKVFADYEASVDSLRKAYPSTVFIHATVPLLANSGGWKLKVKRLIGKEDWTDLPNVRRHEYNELLRARYAGEPVFDLAALESTHPDGSRETFEHGGKTYYSLVHAYTYDGGHLNEVGRRMIAKEIVVAFAAAVKAARPSVASGNGG